MKCYKRIAKAISKRFARFEKVKMEKPESLKGIEDSSDTASDSSCEDRRAGGLTSAAQNLGEGATLYL